MLSESRQRSSESLGFFLRLLGLGLEESHS